MKQFEEWEVVGFIQGHGNSNSTKVYSFTDDILKMLSLNHSLTISYRLKQIDNDGNYSFSTIAVVKAENAPIEFALYQNYPNPFNPVTMISFSVPVKTLVTLSVYDLLGKEIAVLLTEVKEPGEYDVQFNAEKLAAGVYYYTLISGDERLTQKLILLK